MSSEAFLAITAHALSTDTHEVMGLLLGSFGPVVDIVEVVPLARTDKRSDRCEVSSEQLAAASDKAEARRLHVVGWYHSHPHITAAPSHVDARTQGQYQSLDSRFVGLICAVFQQLNDDATAAVGSRASILTAPTIKLVAFQSDNVVDSPGGFASSGAPPTYDAAVRPVWRARTVPLTVLAGSLRCATAVAALGDLQDALFDEEVAARDAIGPHDASFADAVFQKSLALLANDALHPLIHVAASKLKAQIQRRNRARALLLGEETPPSEPHPFFTVAYGSS